KDAVTGAWAEYRSSEYSASGTLGIRARKLSVPQIANVYAGCHAVTDEMVFFELNARPIPRDVEQAL
ncbi:MAG TPA: hypothetical protein VNV88_07915, partial [Candidatus Solibacter sp.]|nr:hypothetical protein [Candidatus Solibacter sp.]